MRLTVNLIRQLEWQTAELSRVSWNLLEKQETTARRFSHELHDELGQSLTAVKANLASLQQTCERAARARWTTAFTSWTKRSATCASCRNCCVPRSSMTSGCRPD